eukprot:11532773-Alexandrium_andersonii.AAC.1
MSLSLPTACCITMPMLVVMPATTSKSPSTVVSHLRKRDSPQPGGLRSHRRPASATQLGED